MEPDRVAGLATGPGTLVNVILTQSTRSPYAGTICMSERAFVNRHSLLLWMEMFWVAGTVERLLWSFFHSFIHGCNWAILKYIDNSMSRSYIHVATTASLSFFHKVPV